MATNMPQNAPDTEKPHPRVPGDDPSVYRAINEPMDEREGLLITGTAIAGVGAGILVGCLAGLIAAAFPMIDWWMGLIIGGFAGGTLAAFTFTRLSLRQVQDESLPPVVKKGGEPAARGR